MKSHSPAHSPLARLLWLLAALLLGVLLLAPQLVRADGGGWPTSTPTASPTALIMLVPTATTASLDIPVPQPTAATNLGDMPLPAEDFAALLNATPTPAAAATAGRFSLVSLWPVLVGVGLIAVIVVFFLFMRPRKK